MTNAAVCYRVRRSTAGSGAWRVVKWCGDRKDGAYIVEPDHWWQRCNCPQFQFRRGICKHIRLINVLQSGRLKDGQAYVWVDHAWRVAGDGAQNTISRPLADVQPGGLNDGSVRYSGTRAQQY